MPQDERRNQPRRRAAAAPSRAEQRQEPRSPRPRKRRRARPMGIVIYLLFVVGLSALLATVGWGWANDVLALNKEERTYTITISEDDSFANISHDLKENGIIEHRFLFSLFANLTGSKKNIAPGVYTLTTDMDYRAILNNIGIKSLSKQAVKVTVVEGMTVAQIFQLLESKGVATVADLNGMAANHDYKFSFLADIPLGDPNRLEGYLFPDTYEFYVGHDPLYVINKMLIQFDAKFTDEMRQTVLAGGRTIHEIITIASMIEKETDGTDQTVIASVIFNRLGGNATGGKLQIDATVQYILPERKENLTKADTEIDNPYNTYFYKGLPPGPIANPGMAAIYAAMNPQSTNYIYYALGDDNLHHFFSSYDAHQQFIASQDRYK